MSISSVTCPRCRRTSWNPTDVAEGYCGACHAWTQDPQRCDCGSRPAEIGGAAHREGCPEGEHQVDAAVSDAFAQVYLYGGAVIATLQFSRKFRVKLAEAGYQIEKRKP